MNDIVELIVSASTWVIPVLLAVTLHEAAHGFAAKLFGDDTAQRMGRLSLNPIRHIDPVGTILLPALLLLDNGRTIPVWLCQAGSGGISPPAPTTAWHHWRGGCRSGNECVACHCLDPSSGVVARLFAINQSMAWYHA